MRPCARSGRAGVAFDWLPRNTALQLVARGSTGRVGEVRRPTHTMLSRARQIAASAGVSRATLAEYLWRAAILGITWAGPERVHDDPVRFFADRMQSFTSWPATGSSRP